MKHLIRVMFCFIFLAGFLHADEVPQTEPVSVSLMVEDESIQPGQPFWVGIKMDIHDEWHAYWKNPGDSGMAPSVDWLLPPGFEAGPLLWPTPKKFSLDSMVGFGYDTDTVFLVQVTPPKELTDSTATIAADVRWVVCSDATCLPGDGAINATVKISKESPKANPDIAKEFSQARAQIPAQHDDVQATQNEEGLIEIVLNDKHPNNPTSAYFFPEEEQAVDYNADALLNSSQDNHKITLKGGEAKSENLKGVLVLQSDNFKKSYEINTSIQQPKPQAPPTDEFDGGLSLALLFAFIGGMILNLMPCVLPVLSFKVLSFIKMSGQSRSLVLKHGIAFAIGVLVSFWVLAGVLLALQAYGHTVGWGFQLQEPLFVAVLASILLVFGLSLFGVFELGTSLTAVAGQMSEGKQKGLSGSFLSGVLATAVATPCTGPFLGSAVGYAFTLPAIGALLIFTSLGIGMSLPYLILAMFPNLLRFMPKPGPWMVTFKELMGFLMLASVLWLVWVFSAQTDNFALMLLLVGFFFLGMGCWVYGKWGTPIQKKTTRFIGYALTLTCLALASFTIISSASTEIEAHEKQLIADNNESWEKFSPERVAELRKKGIPVFIDFTAKWCLICQANHLVLKTFDVSKEFSDRGIVKMKADWTKKDPVITSELRKYGRSGVPLYLLFGPDPSKPPYVLPQVLTPEIVIGYFKNMEPAT